MCNNHFFGCTTSDFYGKIDRIELTETTWIEPRSTRCAVGALAITSGICRPNKQISQGNKEQGGEEEEEEEGRKRQKKQEERETQKQEEGEKVKRTDDEADKETSENERTKEVMRD